LQIHIVQADAAILNLDLTALAFTAKAPPGQSAPSLGTMSSPALAALLEFKAAGNELYKNKDFEGAIKEYTDALVAVPRFEDDDDDDAGSSNANEVAQCDPELLKQGSIVLCNRAASYMALNKAIPANVDAQRAAVCDPTNWKAHWRTGLSLMMMQPRLERSEQAIAAFERTLACPSLPASEQQNAKEALNRAKYRLEQGKDALDMPDMGNCCIS
jgi:tetratricopeptide (TPR) repeat protein